MRVLLVGSAVRRARLRQLLPDGVEVVGESPTAGAARSSGLNADALLVAHDAGPEEEAWVAEPLTARELEVLELVARGLANKTIAAALGISAETVKVHVASIYGKLQAANRTEAVRLAVRRGLISL